MGERAITKATLARWMTVLKGGRTVSHSTSGQQEALRKQALELLISRQWPRKRRSSGPSSPPTLLGPLPLNKKWCFFEVTRVTPRVVKPLARVQGTIEHQLIGEQRRRTFAKFIGAWRRKWIPQTDCSPDYVVQKCKQYHGPKTPEDPLAFN